MDLTVKAVVNPTERADKVLKAVENLFPNLEFGEKDGVLSARGINKNDLATFKELLKQQQIRDTARGFLSKRIDGNKLSFQLNKQAAYMGKVNFVDFDIALGTIRVEIKGKDLEGLVEWLCG